MAFVIQWLAYLAAFAVGSLVALTITVATAKPGRRADATADQQGTP